jgi:hypothetical protein
MSTNVVPGRIGLPCTQWSGSQWGMSMASTPVNTVVPSGSSTMLRTSGWSDASWPKVVAAPAGACAAGQKRWCWKG